MAATRVTVRSGGELAGVRQAYLEAIADGTRELAVELPAGALGLDGDAPAGLALSDVGATGPPDLEVSISAPDGLCVLAGTGLTVLARVVRISGVAILGGPPGALRVGVGEALELDDVTLLGVPAHHREGSTITLQAAAGAAARIRSLVLGDCAAADALLHAACTAGAWWQELAVEGMAASAGAGDAVLAVDSVASLRLRDCRLAAGGARTLLRMLVAPTEAEIAGTQLSAGAGALARVVHDDPARGLALRLAHGSATTVPAGELPPAFQGEAGEVAGATVDAEIAAAVRRARDRVLAADPRLEQRLP